MAEIEWGKIAAEAGISLVSGFGGLILGIWKWGRWSAKAEQSVKDDYDAKIGALRDEVRKDMASHVQKSDARNDLLVEQFKESFDGIRRQIDDHKLHTETRFLPKDDFRDFREEYREDMRELKAAIAARRQ
ncbi:hypothetical protein [Bradyrhizobium elkanii]|uniref:hypothetical protein n=1 Tax=Bradyrhizobium elkanii TaxID=29448 RepID=UPI003D1B85EE